MTDKRICTSCHRWHGMQPEMLTAPDPFNEGETLIACPACRDSCGLVVACDEPDCWRESNCGTPTPAGYRNTCYDHRPRG